MQIIGKILDIKNAVQVTEKFKKRELILEYSTDNKYFEYIKFEAFNDKCELLDKFNTGDIVELFFNIKGREWKDKTGQSNYFNTLSIFNIDRCNSIDNKNSIKNKPGLSIKDEQDDLPF